MNDVLLQFDMDSLRDEFERDGFVVMREFLNCAELAELRANTDQYLKCINYCRSAESANRKGFGGTRKNLQHVVPWFDVELRSGKPFRTVRTLLDAELKAMTAAYFERIPGESKGIAPHFDSVTDRGLGATLWISLDRARTTNGCLYYAKGSHQEVHPSVVGIEYFDDTSPCAVAAELNPGDAAIHSSLTVHWSNPNGSQQPRRGISYFYRCVE